MKLFTEDQVVKRIKALTDEYKFYSDAAKAIGCTKAQLNLALSKKQPPCPAILEAIGLSRLTVFVDEVDPKYVPEREKA